MKEWLIKMAKELGLPEGTDESVILAKLSERILGGDARLSTVTAQLAAHGLKLDGEKVVKLEGTPRNPADVAKIAELELQGAKSTLAGAKATVDGLMASGKIPPAMKATLERVFNSTGKLESLTLSKNGDSEVVIKGTIDVLGDLKALFDSIPGGVKGQQMSTVGGTGTGGKEGEAKPGSLGKAVAARAMSFGKKSKEKEPAAK